MRIEFEENGVFWFYYIYRNDTLIKKGITPKVNLKPFGMTTSEYIKCFCT